MVNKIGGRYTVTLIPGDGIGKEISESVKTIFKSQKVPVDFEQIDVTGKIKPDEENDLFKQGIESLKRNKIGLKGILYTPLDCSDHSSFNVSLRKVQDLDVYANLTLIKNIPGCKTPHNNVDFVIIRENTEGEYSGLEHQSVPGVVESLKIITRIKSERISRFAFDFALKNNRKKVTVVHKANIMKLGDGLFRKTFFEIAKDYPQIEATDLIVDNASMQAVSNPQKFDVLVTPNLYGSILSNIGAALVGGPGLIPSANYGDEYALFEPGCRHVGFDIAGKDRANPTALILSSTMLLRHLSLDDYADAIERAVYDVILEGSVRTPDMKGNSSTTAFTNAILHRLNQFT
ncbi:isocitrate dehydrogenase, NAD-dependent [Pneumocystis carinii B80]|uniref:Isocitrate dehydrogenase [NAD] subunit 1, mitochondrial n=1 Tax=Pneumocystis carinii (strain B80) TaxID=1408658 RepID=A0A0W4ZSS4_PNEC8|nr:isocitrate dehydrogenase, NAD-dependent [Pneumocystis carinii B80]KTW31412.1 isocitrate dehydrogenase, NAD-dependent [Pneumocystis carinii B80]